MKKQIGIDGFVKFVENLENGVPQNVFLEHFESEGEFEKVKLMKVDFAGETVVLYEGPVCIKVIQDTPVAPYEDYLEEVFEDLECGGENKVYIEV